MTRIRKLLLWLALAAVTAFGAASVAFHRPGGASERVLAVDSLKRALAALDDDNLDTEARLTGYRAGLRQADALLRRALRSNPVETASIERLATVRWEIGVLDGIPDSESVLLLIGVAATRAPRIPEIQAGLGSLLYKMGNSVAAAAFMRRAVELSPAITNRVVNSMQDAGVDPTLIADALPRTVEVVASLREGLSRSGHVEEWLSSAEVLLPTQPRVLLRSYAEACLASNSADRLLARANGLGVLADNRDEADRQLAIGRAQLAQRAWSLAATAAARARVLSPRDSGVLELAGQIAFAAGDPAGAETAFRDAISTVALEGRRGVERARLYRLHGQSLEKLGRVDDAFDEYRRAAEILPDDPWLRQRFASSGTPLAEHGRH